MKLELNETDRKALLKLSMRLRTALAPLIEWPELGIDRRTHGGAHWEAKRVAALPPPTDAIKAAYNAGDSATREALLKSFNLASHARDVENVERLNARSTAQRFRWRAKAKKVQQPKHERG